MFKTLYGNKTAVIIRGFSGSGKSTVAQTIAEEAAFNDCSVAIHETDNFFMTQNGYIFDGSMLGCYHSKNLESFCNSVDSGIHLIINSNTNVEYWEFSQYIKYASKNGYNIQIIDLYDNGLSDSALHERNLHGFPKDKYQLCRDRYERTYDNVRSNPH